MVRFRTMAGQTEATVRTATILVNSAARRVGRFDADGALAYVRKRGLDARIERPGSAYAMADAAKAAALRGDDLLFVAGGDGSLRNVLPALIGTETALAALPAGTANVWAKEVGIPRGFRAAVDVHLQGQRVHVDVGTANDEPFLLMAGVGWDAEMAARVRPAWKRRFGALAYVVVGALSAPRLRPAALTWHSGAFTGAAPIAVMILSNTRLYGGVVRISQLADATDGLLDLTAFSPRRPGDGMALAWKLLRGGLTEDPRAFDGRIEELFIETVGVPYQLDGDPVGVSPVRFAVQSQALLVSVPSGALPAVLGGKR